MKCPYFYIEAQQDISYISRFNYFAPSYFLNDYAYFYYRLLHSYWLQSQGDDDVEWNADLYIFNHEVTEC